ncbi:MAG: hypothetical protein L0216_06710 [Planctomycetales bacterium]|nr:hypothetical protein [Planctomycetales bacterium]
MRFWLGFAAGAGTAGAAALVLAAALRGARPAAELAPAGALRQAQGEAGTGTSTSTSTSTKEDPGSGPGTGSPIPVAAASRGFRDASPEETAWLAERLRERRAAAAGGLEPGATAGAVLERTFRGGADPRPLLREFGSFASGLEPPPGLGGARFARPEDLVGNALPEAVRKGGVVEFGPGRYPVPNPLVIPDGADSIVLRGAGMDATTLAGSLMTWNRAPLERLVLEDLTLEGSFSINMNVRAGVLLRRVRLVGFQVAVYLNAEGMVACERCEFLGGLGPEPGGSAVSLRAKALVYFRECLFTDLDGAVTVDPKLVSGSWAALEGCVLENSLAHPPWYTGTAPADLPAFAVGGCEVRWGEAKPPVDRLEALHLAPIEDRGGNRVVPGVPRTTLADLARVLGAERERCFGAEFLPARETRRVALLVESEPGRGVLRRFLWDGTGLAPDPGHAWNPRGPREGPIPTGPTGPAGVPDLLSFLRDRGIPGTTPVRGVTLFVPQGTGGAPTYFRSDYGGGTEFYPARPPGGGR